MKKILLCYIVIVLLVLCPMLVAAAACNDGIDNDGDGYVDLDDMGCTSATANDENSAIRTCRTDFYSINGNIVLNPNMECDSNGDGSPDSWTISGSGSTSTKWRTSALGRNSRMLVGSRQSGTVLSSWRQSFPVSRLKPNTWYEVTFDMAAENSIAQFNGNRMKDDSYWAGLDFYAQDSTGTKTAMAQLYGIFGPAFTDWDEAAGVYRSAGTRASEPWRKVVNYVKTPAAFTSPAIYTMLYTDTSFYVDNLVIREVSSDLQAPELTSGTLNFIKYHGADFFPIILQGSVYRNQRYNSVSKDELYTIGFNTLFRDEWTNRNNFDMRFAQMDSFATIYYTASGGEQWVNDPSHQIVYTGWDTFKSYFNASAPNLLFVTLFDEITYPTHKGMNIGYMNTLAKAYNYIKQQNPNIIVLTNYNGYYSDGPYTRSFDDLAKYYFPYVDAATFTQNLPRYYKLNDALPETYALGEATRKYSRFTDPSGKKKYFIAYAAGVPEWSSWNYPGTCPSTNEFKCNEYTPFNLQRYQVWEQIINGAVGVTFWGLNNYCYLYTVAPDYQDPKYCDYQFNQSATIVKELHSLYDVLLEPQYYNEWTVSNDKIDVMMKKHNGKIYLLTASTAFTDINGVTFTLPNYNIKSIKALNEVNNGVISNVYNRTVVVNTDGHSFTDNFIGENAQAIQGKAAPGYAVHIYEITTGAALPCTDVDSDGYGASGSTGCTNSGTDCNDNNAAIHPGATETCGNSVDEDCSGADLACTQASLTAFPGAEGFGSGTVGGRGGKVIEVTNLNDLGTGSLRACVEGSGPRICVFRTGGLITLNTPLTISNPYITIAGQTAPGGGITIRKANGGDVFSIKTSQVIMRYISARPGAGGENHAAQIASSGTELRNIIIDHCTFSWGVDSNIETWYRVIGTTIQWSIISEALDISTHSKGAHSKGIMLGGYAGSESRNSLGSENISMHHNLVADVGERAPLMEVCGTAQVINNVIYNPYWTFSHQQDNCIIPNTLSVINWIGNYHKKGPDSTSSTDLKVIPADSGAYSGGARIYVRGNIGPSRTSDSLPDTNWVDSGSRSYIVSTPASAPAVATQDAFTAYDQVLADAGNNKGLNCDGTFFTRRDPVDTRIVNDVKAGTGKIIDDPSEVGGWYNPATGTPCADSDRDGMPDVWETQHSLNPNDASDGAKDRDGDGYTNLEEFMNGIDGPVALICIDVDSDGYGASGSTGCTNSGTDCNDNNAAVHPGATETCGNSVDEDCSGADSACSLGTTYIYYCDRDGDGYVSTFSSGSCTTAGCVPSGCTQTAGTDCFDNDVNIHPGANEICDDGKDQDCSGSDLSCASQACYDGTAPGACSSSKPLYCESGILVNRCGNCGCPSGQSCTAAGTCATPTQSCSDGTAYYQCSATKPKYCSGGTLINYCSSCGCPAGQACNSDDSCGSTTTPTCTDADWYSINGTCQQSNTLTRNWTKINPNCQGGVTHQNTESIACTYTTIITSGNTYWVSPTGDAQWTDCKGSTPISGASACSLATANKYAAAGDTIYLRGGTYGPLGLGMYGVAPRQSGTSASNRITYAAASGETPIITGAGCYDCGWGLVLSNVSYIKVDGIVFQNLARWAMITNYAHHNEIANCVFKSDTGEDVVQGFFIGGWCAGGSSLACYSTHNWVHNNTFSRAHRAQLDTVTCYEGRDLVRIGDPPNPSYPPYTGDNNYNTIEDNYMEYAGHALFDTYGMYTVFRGNIMHNEAWINDTSNGTCWYPPMPNGKYGHRLMQFSEDFGRDGLYSLIENNRMGYSSANPNNPGEANFAIAAPKLIVRLNYLYGSQQAGIFFKYASYGKVGAGGTGSTNNRVYRNTIFHNGWTYPYMQGINSYNGHTCSTCPGKLAGITIASTTLENIIKNNIVYDSFSYGYSWNPYGSTILYKGLDITVDTGRNPADFPSIATIEDNWMTGNGNPKFVNPDLSNPASRTLPDLRIQSDSPVIDHGTSLTAAVGSGSNSISLVVKDALYFQDGSWGSDLARGVTFFPDWIAIGSVNNVVQIKSIDYSTNRITLASPMTWSDNAQIWLYKDSHGERVLYGSAPDAGAYEYGSADVPPSQACSDGTSYDQCSATKPLRCENGQLVSRCSACGCPTGQSCATDGTCNVIPACTDADGDGYGASGTGCQNAGYDCDDNNAAIHLGASENCGNGIDEDCNGVDLQCQQACQASCLASPCGHYESCTIATGNCASGICCSGTCSVPPVAVPTCTEADWKSSDGPCQSQNTMTRSWLKINGNCQGGVSHLESETISCVYVAQPSGLAFEAESGQISLPLKIASSGEITYVFQPAKTNISSGGKAVYDFEIVHPGSYVIKASVNAPDESSNSFYVNIDQQPVDPTNIWDVKSFTRGFRVRYVSWKGTASSGAQYDPKIFSLTAGAHKLIIVGKDGNAMLNKFEIMPYNASASYSFEPGSGVAGDVDGDGGIGVRDLLAVIYYWHNGGQYGPALDPTGDGIVNVQDVVYIARRLKLN